MRSIVNRGTGEVDGLAWLAPAMKALARQRCHESPLPAAARSESIGQREQRLMLTSAYSTHARDFEERMAASAGIELRRPFFDARLVQFSFSTSPRLRLRGHSDKYLHRKAMQHLLPDAVLARQQKAEFSITFRWHLAELKEMLDRDERERSDDWVDRDKATQLYHRAGTDPRSSVPEWLLWSLFGCKALVSMPYRHAPDRRDRQCVS